MKYAKHTFFIALACGFIFFGPVAIQSMLPREKGIEVWIWLIGGF